MIFCVDCFCRYQTTTDGERHTLVVSRVSDNMNLGVHVVAKNDAGEDSCRIDVRTIDDDDNNNIGDDDGDAGNKITLDFLPRQEGLLHRLVRSFVGRFVCQQNCSENYISIIIIIIYSPKMQVHKNSCKHSCSGKTNQAHNSAYGSLN